MDTDPWAGPGEEQAPFLAGWLYAVSLFAEALNSLLGMGKGVALEADIWFTTPCNLVKKRTPEARKSRKCIWPRWPSLMKVKVLHLDRLSPFSGCKSLAGEGRL